MTKRFKLRNLEVDRVDLVDKGANQYADIVIAKSDDRDEKRQSIAANMKDGYPVDSQLKNGPPPVVRRKRKKKKKGSADAERNAAEMGSAAPPVASPPFKKHKGPGNHASGSSQDVHGKKGSGGGGGSTTSGSSSGRKIRSEPGRTSTHGSGAEKGNKNRYSTYSSDQTRPGKIARSYPSLGGKQSKPPLPVGMKSEGGAAKHRPIHSIADEIRRDWKKVNYAAKPYLDAMGSLDKISDNYYQDSGSGVVAYFLSNARSWRGETAKKVKAELKQMLKDNKDGLSQTPGRGGPSGMPPGFRKSFEEAFAKAFPPKPEVDPKAAVPGKPVAPGKKKGLPKLKDVVAKPGAIPGQPAKPAPPGGEGLGIDPSQEPTPGAPTPPAAGQPTGQPTQEPSPTVPPLGPGSAPGKRPVATPAAKPAVAAKKPPVPEMDPKKKALADQLKQKGMPPSGGKPF